MLAVGFPTYSMRSLSTGTMRFSHCRCVPPEPETGPGTGARSDYIMTRLRVSCEWGELLVTYYTSHLLSH